MFRHLHRRCHCRLVVEVGMHDGCDERVCIERAC